MPQIPPSFAAPVFAEGFKSVAFQSQTNLASVASEPVDPEIVENSEVGKKSTWWDRRLQFNLSCYDMVYENLQVFELNSRFQHSCMPAPRQWRLASLSPIIRGYEK